MLARVYKLAKNADKNTFFMFISYIFTLQEIARKQSGIKDCFYMALSARRGAAHRLLIVAVI